MAASRPAHPGSILGDRLGELGLGKEVFARHIGISRQQLHNVITGRAAVTIPMAVRLARALKTTPQFWMGLQANHDLWPLESKPELKAIRPLSK